MYVVEHTLPDAWASALAYGNFDGLDCEEAARVRRWLNEHPRLEFLSIVEDSASIERFDGLITNCLAYVFVREEPSFFSRP